MSDFATDIQNVGALKLFARALPEWATAHAMDVSFLLKGGVNGLEIQVAFPESTPPSEEILSSLLSRLQKTERLMLLEVLIEEFKQAGTSPEIIESLVKEGERLFFELYPDLPHTI